MRTLPAAIATLVAEPEGSRKLGQFVLVRQLGRGGFAPVWSAREEYAGRELRTVALKLFSLESRDGEADGSVEQGRRCDSPQPLPAFVFFRNVAF